jgi:hypothetical protein
MDKFREKIFDEKNILDQMARWIPGYRGYRDRDIRREADKVLREHVSKTIKQFIAMLKEANLRLTDKAELPLMDDLDRLCLRLESLGDKLRFASYGYSGFFDAIKIKQTELDILYQQDRRIMEKVEAIKSALDAKTASADAPVTADSVRSLSSEVEALKALIEERESLILKHKGLE